MRGQAKELSDFLLPERTKVLYKNPITIFIIILYQLYNIRGKKVIKMESKKTNNLDKEKITISIAEIDEKISKIIRIIMHDVCVFHSPVDNEEIEELETWNRYIRALKEARSNLQEACNNEKD